MVATKNTDLKKLLAETESVLNQTTQTSKPAIEKLIIKLVGELNKHIHLYHTLDRPKISDFDYDQLIEGLEKLENAYPSLKQPDSPTGRIGGEIVGGFKKIAHRVPMISLANTYSADEIKAFDQRVRKVLDLSLEKVIDY